MAHLSTGEVGGVGISLAVMYPDVSGLSTKKRNDKGPHMWEGPKSNAMLC